MRQVLWYSVLLVLGLVGSQVLPGHLGGAQPAYEEVVRLLTVLCLAFIMVHVGYEFEIDKTKMRQYAWDGAVAGSAAALPWLFCAAYFVYVLRPAAEWGTFQAWRESLLSAMFSAPTSAGVLFSMLAAGGLSATWLFKKARVLAIFDDLGTVLLLIPMKMMIVGLRWQMGALVAIMGALLWLAWRRLHSVRLPSTWPWVLGYAAALVGSIEALYHASRLLDAEAPLHLEILLPAFVLGCVMARPHGEDPHGDDARPGHQEGPPSASEQRVATYVSAAFMVLVGLSMPKFSVGGTPFSTLALHVLLVTVVSNVGKMFPAFCYRREVPLRERLALAVGMFPRGEVGAGILVVSLSLGIKGLAVQVALLSLSLNLVLTGGFILVVRSLLGPTPTPASAAT